MVRVKATLSFATADTSKDFRVDEDGVITHMVLTLPNFTTAVTGKVQVLDADGNEIYGPAVVAENTTTVYGVSSAIYVPVVRGSIIRVTALAVDETTPTAAGGAHDATVSFFVSNK